jgi:hypothetical protein
MTKRIVLKQAVKAATLLSTEVFPSPSPLVCAQHGKSLNFLPFSQIGVMFSQDFLDKSSHRHYSFSMNDEVIGQTARTLWRAFSFSKSRARCLVERRVWRRCVRGFI